MTRKSKREFPGASPYHDRHGRRRWRYRKGAFSAELGTDYGSEDFVRRYEAAVEGRREAGHVGASRTIPGSLSALAASYYRSPAFLGLAESTRATYRGVIEALRERHGSKRVSHMQRRHVLALMAEKADTPAAANNLRKRLLALLDHAIDLGWRKDNPAATVKPYRIDSDGFHTWDEGEISAFYGVHQPGSTAHLAMTLMLYTGAARADAVRLGWGNIRNRRLSYRRQKTRRTTGTLIDIPLHPDLAAMLDALPRDRLTFLETRQRRSRSPNGLGNQMRDWCDAAGLPECSSHGLRKACARRLAEAGATPHEIQAVTGHATLAEVQRYTAAVNRSELADAGLAKLQARSKTEQTLANSPKRFVNRDSKP